MFGRSSQERVQLIASARSLGPHYALAGNIKHILVVSCVSPSVNPTPQCLSNSGSHCGPEIVALIPTPVFRPRQFEHN
jgi:hypothetical protein